MAQKHITTGEDLAQMINEGFKTMATKEDVVALRSEMTAGFERIEPLLLAEQTREIEDVQTRMKRLEDAMPAGRQASPSSTNSTHDPQAPSG